MEAPNNETTLSINPENIIEGETTASSSGTTTEAPPSETPSVAETTEAPITTTARAAPRRRNQVSISRIRALNE